MLSDEEKQAIEFLEKLKNLNIVFCSYAYNNGKVFLSKEEQGEINKVINLIEKQSKEIEELKNGQIDFWISDKEIEERIRNKFVSNDKIKAKIEELEKQDKESRFSKNYLVIHVLQSLLEEDK